MNTTYIDHITVTAPTLAAGVDYVRQALGVTPLRGGEHPRMGTHNCLLRLGAELFLEVIAVDPAAAPPGRPRWFRLDDAAFNCRPRLAAWVARSDDIEAAVAACAWTPGAIEPMTRGALSWRITIPADGGMALDGAAPGLIQWDAAAHPAGAMAELGCSLLRLEIRHPDAGRVRAALAGIDCAGPLLVAPPGAGAAPYLVAHVQTPTGARRLGGP
ncbi:hypothetical protein ACFDR9_000636 [Janthinobacterium sp. CG_23.3]|uniref:VOC family protein n=1 Tax=Janthinobacterium sp. CG_23.3 TaxID=3349634 RepID=UPI0038D39ACE